MINEYEIVVQDGKYYVVSSAFAGNVDCAICACLSYSSAWKICKALNAYEEK